MRPALDSCVGLPTSLTRPRPFHRYLFLKGRGLRGDGSPCWYGIGQAGNLMPPFRASSYQTHLQRCLLGFGGCLQVHPSCLIHAMNGVGVLFLQSAVI
jgi:hypothetical protein